MKAGWLPKNGPGRLFHVVEECGEVCQAIGKLGRFGAHNTRPGKGQTNAEHLREEMLDLRAALKESIKDMDAIIEEGRKGRAGGKRRKAKQKSGQVLDTVDTGARKRKVPSRKRRTA